MDNILPVAICLGFAAYGIGIMLVEYAPFLSMRVKESGWTKAALRVIAAVFSFFSLLISTFGMASILWILLVVVAVMASRKEIRAGIAKKPGSKLWRGWVIVITIGGSLIVLGVTAWGIVKCFG